MTGRIACPERGGTPRVVSYRLPFFLFPRNISLSVDCSEKERERQFLRKDELIDADHSYIPDLSRKGQREGQEKAICVNGHCLYPLKNNPPIYTISREANVKKHNRLAMLKLELLFQEFVFNYHILYREGYRAFLSFFSLKIGENEKAKKKTEQDVRGRERKTNEASRSLVYG